jgi:6,7-dimethyl-8-ribityllumazine synthase
MASNDLAPLAPGAVEELVARVRTLDARAADGRGLRIALACSRFNGAVTMRLVEGALEALDELGVDPADRTIAWTAGAFELPLLARALARAGWADAVVCLGAVIRGQTTHYELVSEACAQGLQRVQLDTGVPVVFGVVTTEDVEQALARSEPGASNHGRSAAATAVEMARLVVMAGRLGPAVGSARI